MPGFGVINSHGELHRLADRFDVADVEAEARRLAAAVPGAVPVELVDGVWVALPGTD